MAGLNGSWFYESFCSHNPTELAAPWAPRGELLVTTDEAGNVKGTLKFAPGAELAVSGTITPAAGKLPAGVDLTGEGMGGSVNKIRGFWIAGTGGVASGTVIVGTVKCLQKDPGHMPDGTSGPFVLFPAVG